MTFKVCLGTCWRHTTGDIAFNIITFKAMNRDTEELPALVDDLEKNMESIEVSQYVH